MLGFEDSFVWEDNTVYSSTDNSALAAYTSETDNINHNAQVDTNDKNGMVISHINIKFLNN